MINDSFEFKAFGIKDNLKSLVKRTGVLEIIFGIYAIVVSMCFFLLFVAFLFFDTWGKDVFLFFGHKQEEGVSFGALFIAFIVLMGALFLIIATVSMISGLKSKKNANNPVLLIEGKSQYIAESIGYITFMVFLIIAVYVCIKFSLILFIFLTIIELLAVLTVTLYKFLAIQNIPDKESVLDVQNLPDSKKEEILLKSNRQEVFDDIKPNTQTKRKRQTKKKTEK